MRMQLRRQPCVQLACVLAIVALVSVSWAGKQEDDRNDVALSADDFKKMDTFDGVMLSKADKIYTSGDYRSAEKAYDSFLEQNTKSLARPYALMRRGRSLERDNKRFDAIKVFNEVLDYFPNAVNYAGAALFYIGECHWLNGDAKEAMKSWAEMAKDADYRKHFLAAGAINQLADNLTRQDKWPEAVAYYEQVSVDFRQSNGDAANYAISKIILYYVRIKPDVEKLRKAYEKALTFEPGPGKPEEGNFWWRVMEAIDRNGVFAEADVAGRTAYYQYWSQAMDGKGADWDDFQINLARYHMQYERNVAKFYERLDKHYAQYQKEGNYSRTIKWMNVYAGHKTKVDEYYNKLACDKMTYKQLVELIQALYSVNDYGLAHNTIAKIKADQASDDDREGLARWIWSRDEEAVRMLCAAMKDAVRGNLTMLRFFHETRQPDKGLKIADLLVKEPSCAKEAYMNKGEFCQWKQLWSEAISAYRLADSPPTTAFRIAECLLADGKCNPAIVELQGLEGYFPNEAPEAALRIAYAYRDTNQQKLYVKSLRSVISKYPASGQSSTAHQTLQAMGLKTGGGVDAE